MTTSGQMLILRQDHKSRSKAKLKCIYSECLHGIGEFNNFKNHTEFDQKFKPRLQTPHKVA